MPRILAFAASTRRQSVNQKLLNIAIAGVETAGATVTPIELKDYPMPIFDQDMQKQQGLPPAAQALKQLLLAHDGVLIASPEYNSAFSPLLKNVIDWTSRAESEQEQPLAAWKGKTAAILSASPGARGGVRGLVFLRMLLANIGLLVIPEQETIPFAMKAFDKDGQLKDAAQQAAVERLGHQLAVTTCRQRASA
jgi:NAD(P)H-dependent FMN reductase